jgi:SAM-dependent methyltransferase
MNRPFRILCAAFLVLGAALLGGCRAPAEPAPSPGQPGKDVIWLPTPDSLVERMLDLARVTPADFVIDLGSGDGRTVVAAARRGARALGIEFDPALVELSRRNAAGTKATFIQGDIFRSDFSEATVVTLFLLSSLNEKLRPQLLDMKPGTRVVSNTFRMGQWQPDAEVTTGCGAFCTAYLWIVPAKVDGYWTSAGSEIAFTQDFQRLFGTVKSAGASATILDGRLRGAEIEFRVPGADYRGTVKGDAIEGTVTTGGNSSPWSAARRKL